MVTLVQAAERLIDRKDPVVGALLLDVLREEGIDVRLSTRAERVHIKDGERVVTLSDGQHVRAQQLLIATGRTPRVDGIGLDTVGIDANPNGIEIDERRRAAEGVWAIGDVT